jgi:hypothetical protein
LVCNYRASFSIGEQFLVSEKGNAVDSDQDQQLSFLDGFTFRSPRSAEQENVLKTEDFPASLCYLFTGESAYNSSCLIENMNLCFDFSRRKYGLKKPDCPMAWQHLIHRIQSASCSDSSFSVSPSESNFSVSSSDSSSASFDFLSGSYFSVSSLDSSFSVSALDLYFSASSWDS